MDYQSSVRGLGTPPHQEQALPRSTWPAVIEVLNYAITSHNDWEEFPEDLSLSYVRVGAIMLSVGWISFRVKLDEDFYPFVKFRSSFFETEIKHIPLKQVISISWWVTPDLEWEEEQLERT